MKIANVTAIDVGTNDSRKQARKIGHAIDHFKLIPEGVGTTLGRNMTIPLMKVPKVTVEEGASKD